MSSVSENGEFPTIDHVFELLDDWRHLPTYQLERRADIFFALFLPEVLREFDQTTEVRCPIIPEFPIKNADNNKSKKVDYLALSKNEEEKLAFIVELKTDMASKRTKKEKEKQEYFLSKFEQGMEGLVRDILKICLTTKERKKYSHLLWRLSKLGLVEGVNEIIYSLYENGKRPFKEALCSVEPANISWPKVKVQLVWFNKSSHSC